MTQRLAFAAAVGLAAFVIVLLGAVIAYSSLHGSSSNVALAVHSSADAGTTTPAQPVAPPQTAPDGTQAQDSAGSGNTNSNTSNGYAISADDAANIALNNAPGSSLLQQPALVNLRGTVAYEVQLDKGFVYVDATSGQVLFNSASGSNGQLGRPRRRTR